MTHTNHRDTLAAILQPERFDFAFLPRESVALHLNADQHRALDEAAGAVRKIYAEDLRNFRRPRYDGIEAFYDACCDTAAIAFELQEDPSLDDYEVALVTEVFKRARFFTENLQPTSVWAKSEMRKLAVSVARSCKHLSFKQQTFDYAALTKDELARMLDSTAARVREMYALCPVDAVRIKKDYKYRNACVQRLQDAFNFHSERLPPAVLRIADEVADNARLYRAPLRFIDARAAAEMRLVILEAAHRCAAALT